MSRSAGGTYAEYLWKTCRQPRRSQIDPKRTLGDTGSNAGPCPTPASSARATVDGNRQLVLSPVAARERI
jgi:hypothetical protein